jgi:hypothetical protein
MCRKVIPRYMHTKPHAKILTDTLIPSRWKFLTNLRSCVSYGFCRVFLLSCTLKPPLLPKAAHWLRSDKASSSQKSSNVDTNSPNAIALCIVVILQLFGNRLVSKSKVEVRAYKWLDDILWGWSIRGSWAQWHDHSLQNILWANSRRGRYW